MSKYTPFIILAVVLLTGVFTVMAQEPTTPVNDPTDNVCYDGGVWDDGRCDIPGHPGATELAWTCGWYMARYLDGRMAASAIPTQCQHIIFTPKVIIIALS